MKISTPNFDHNTAIPSEFAFGKHDPDNHVALCENRNPELAWSDVPEGTKSFVLLCHDPDVPSVGDDVNQEGKTVSADLPRVDFFHWVLVDVPSGTNGIAAGSHSDGITAGGKSGPDAPGGMRHGINDYTNWFAGDAEMAGDYFGYDGPCPPWNDEIVHHYHFTLFALDVESLDLDGTFTGGDVRAAIDGHVLAEASVVGTYKINPDAT